MHPLPLLLLALHLLPPSLSLNQESLILLQAKATLSHPSSLFSDWTSPHNPPCNWSRITCHPQNHRVSAVDLADSSLSGPFPADLCRLPSLFSLSLYNNSINSTLSSSVAACAALRHLDLSQNLLVGAMPPELSQLVHLRSLHLSANNFSGDIPPAFAHFQRLETLDLTANLLNGVSLPSFLTNISTLKKLHLAYNPFAPGGIPPQVGNLSNLEELWLTGCSLSGEVPGDLRRLKKLTLFDVSSNNMNGTISTWLTGMISAVQVELYFNSFTGELPEGISNMSALRLFDASGNNLHGRIPAELCSLPLHSLGLYSNSFHGSIPPELADSANLVELKLFDNQLNGHLPTALGSRSNLQTLDVTRNMLSGEIPASLCAGGALEELLLLSNSFSSQIPTALGECSSLVRLRLGMNKLSGEVPPRLWGLPRLQLLELTGNSLSGSISNNIHTASSLQSLHISLNRFNGSIPTDIGNVSTLKEFYGSHNNLTGEIPQSMFKLSNLQELDLSFNGISGGISSEIGSLKHLNQLDLRNNRFTGTIPKKIGILQSLNYLDLSENIFSGEIPQEMENLKLNKLNLSKNNLTGSIPQFYSKPFYRLCFIGNPGLCGSPETPCLRRIHAGHHRILLLISIFLISATILLTGILWFARKYHKASTIKKKTNKDKSSTWVSFHKLGFSELEILDCLDKRNVIGSGGSGEVYKVTLSSGMAVAVKKLKGGGAAAATEEGEEEFVREVDTLGRIRHKNIVRLWCSCRHGSKGKLLVYEYMKNGSVGDWLHGKKKGKELDWPARYKVALGSAEGLAYLHHDCKPGIIHRDVKPNNILLDEEMGAKIADFGLAKVGEGTMMTGVAGSWGYIAPEYAYSMKAGAKGDTYSFGIVLLELVTGRRPVGGEEMGGKDMGGWVRWVMDEKGVEEVVDKRLEKVYMVEILRVLEIGLLCASILPAVRPSMRAVVKLLRSAAVGSSLSFSSSGFGSSLEDSFEDVTSLRL